MAETVSRTSVGELTVLRPSWRPHLEASNLPPGRFVPPAHRTSRGQSSADRARARAAIAPASTVTVSHMARAAAILIFARALSLPRPARRVILPGADRRGHLGAGNEPSGGHVPARPPPVRGAALPVAVAARRRCSGDPLRTGRPPRTLTHPVCAPERGQLAGFLFGYPLMAGNPQPYSDKVLWVVASRRGGQPFGFRPSARCRYAPCRPPGQRIRRPGRSIPRTSSPHRQAAGFHPVLERAHGHG